MDKTITAAETRESRNHRLRWWTLVTVAVSLLVIDLDMTVLNVALPTIQRQMNATGSELQWMVNVYTIVFGALALTFGSLGDRIGRAKILQAGLLLFGVSSLGAALASTATFLIICRVFMGAGAAMISTSTLSTITNVFPQKERGTAVGVWAGLHSVGMAIGPIIGGVLVQNLNWNWIFIINIPVVIIALVLGWFLVPDTRDSNPRKVDVVGNVLSLAGLTALIYGLTSGPSVGWTDARVLSALTGSVLLIALFIHWEKRTSQPLLEMNFFRSVRFSAGIGILTIMSLGLTGFIYVLTYYMQFVQGYSAIGTGLRYLPLTTGMLIGVVVAARVVNSHLGTKGVMGIGSIGVSIALVFVSGLKTGSPFWQMGLELFFVGYFTGYIVAPVTDAIMAAIPEAKAGIGSAMNNVFRQVAGALGVAVLGSVLSSIYASNFLKSASSLTGLPAELAQKASDSIGAAVGIANSGQLPPILANALIQTAKQSFMDGWQIMALISSALFVVGAIVVFKYMPAHSEVLVQGSGDRERPARRFRLPFH